MLPQDPVLASFYDLLSTRIYAHYGLTSDMAMRKVFQEQGER